MVMVMMVGGRDGGKVVGTGEGAQVQVQVQVVVQQQHGTSGAIRVRTWTKLLAINPNSLFSLPGTLQKPLHRLGRHCLS